MFNKLFIEKRAETRLPAKFDLQYKVLDKSELHGFGDTVDISTGGFSFKCLNFIPVGVGIEADIKVPFLDGAMKIEGTIVRGEQIEEETMSSYVYGAIIDSIGEKDRDALERHIQQVDVDGLLRLAIQKHASEVYLEPNKPPVFRTKEGIGNVFTHPLSLNEIWTIVYGLTTANQRLIMQNKSEIEFTYFNPEGFRFIVSIHFKKDYIDIVFKVVTSSMKIDQFIERLWWVYIMNESAIDMLVTLCGPVVSSPEIENKNLLEIRSILEDIKQDTLKHKEVLSGIISSMNAVNKQILKARIRQILALERNASDIYTDLANRSPDKETSAKLLEIVKDTFKQASLFRGILSELEKK